MRAAYVLGYNGIDPKENAHRLREMVDGDPDDSIWERISMIADPSADDGTVDAIPERALDICERYPQPGVLRGVLSFRADGGPGVVFSNCLDDLVINHPNEVFAAIYGRRKLEDNVAEQLAPWTDGGDPRLPPILSRVSAIRPIPASDRRHFI